MATREFVIQKIGDRYVPVPREERPEVTKWVYVSGGALLAYMGTLRGGTLGNSALMIGAGLLVRGLTGRNVLDLLTGAARPHAPRGKPSEAPSYQNDFPGRAPQLPADLVDEQSMESFPASDPPARTGAGLT